MSDTHDDGDSSPVLKKEKKILTRLRRYSLENLRCIQRIRAYRATFSNAESSRAVAEEIYSTFLADNAISQVNVNKSIVEAVRAKLDGDATLAPELFVVLDQDLRRLLLTDSLRRFVVSDSFERAIEQRKEQVELMSV